MTDTSPGVDLLESIKGLQLVLQSLKGELLTPAFSVESRFRNLSAAVKGLDQAKLTRPLSDAAEYVEQWAEVLSGQRENLEPRAVRSLCWNAAIATDQSFQDFLDRTQYVPKAQSLQGLICSCHARWSRALAISAPVAKIRTRLEKYSGSNRLLNKWKSYPSMVLGTKAHDVMAAELMKCTDGLAGFWDYWGQSIESSQLFQAAAEVACALCLENSDRDPQCRELLFKQLMPWTGWAPGMLKSVMNRLILFPTREKTELIEEIIRLVRNDSRFGDPRHPQNHNNWIGMDEASRRIQEWLSAADITFFFESVLPKGKDPHGRKSFWLRYVGCRGLRSRPLLSNSDKYRLREILSKKEANASDFGRLLDEDTSAFILDFGPLLVVEFSAVGNACYIYEKRVASEIVPDIWTAVPFTKSDLKRKSKVATGQPIIHGRQPRWKAQMERLLAKYGVRAVS
jgi:hypothetical protein